MKLAMYALKKPSPKAIEAFIARQAACKFTYTEVGATAGAPPPGYNFDQQSILLGNGDAVFQQAVAAFRRWQQFSVGWVEACPDSTPLLAGETVAICARVWGIWVLAACRIVEVFEEEENGRTFGFAYGTLPDHPEQGEERFILRQLPNGEVYYEVAAFFRPNTWIARIGWPYFYRVFNRFRTESAQTMQRAVL